MASSSSSYVSFPATDPSGAGKQVQPARAPHLPFRRISLPAAPTMLHRQSMMSIASSDSIPADGEPSPQRAARPRRTRPPSAESPMRVQRRRDSSVRPSEDPLRIVKARKIIDEFYETEKAYVQGLEMVYAHFLEPIIQSLDTSEPLLNRSTINSIFSNFIDIWNLHRSFFSALDNLLDVSKNGPISLSPLLLSHFPYLSLYNPFITSFPSIITSLSELVTPPTALRPNPNFSAPFAEFLTKQESDPLCGRLKLRDWLLTIVQRCPRYLLLLKDLISATSRDDPEHAQLIVAHGLVSKITSGLNTSLHAHAQTLALLALQRTTSNLPFQLISPGRTLLKRGSLLHAERNSPPRPREFLLLSDCLIWLTSVDAGSNGAWSSGGGSSHGSSNSQSSSVPPRPPPLLRNRSRSEAELPRAIRPTSAEPSSPSKYGQRLSYHPNSPLPPPPVMAPKGGTSSSSSDERWVYKGKADLVDLDVTVGSVLGEEHRFEILNPEESFIVYAASEQNRDEWVSAIRHAKTQLLESLNATNPNSTLTSSASTNHIRRSLQALPFHPSDDRLATVRGHESQPTSPTKKTSKKERERREHRRKVEHWVPPVWIPDGKTSECMRCGKLFGWRRRRHHCRLCGRCVCNACSGQTFFITDASGKEEGAKAARACDACYETVFPVIDPSVLPEQRSGIDDTITSLSKLPSWFSMPSMPSVSTPAQPQALMAINAKYGPDTSLDLERPSSPEEKEPPGVIRLRPHQKLKSYHEILEDFEAHERGGLEEVQRSHIVAMKKEAEEKRQSEWIGSDAEEDEDEERESYLRSRLFLTPPHSLAPSPQTSPVNMKWREDTVRRRKRFSLPAVAVQTTEVTARASMVIEDTGVGGSGDASDETPTRQKRFSLVLSPSKSGHGNGNRISQALREEESSEGDALGRGLAADRLSLLLGRQPPPGRD